MKMKTSESVLSKIGRTCVELKDEFNESCAYRTCHYRHSLLYDALKLAWRMAGELDGTVKPSARDLYQTIASFAAGLSYALSDCEGDAHLYGVLNEVRELAFRQTRKEEDSGDKETGS